MKKIVGMSLIELLIALVILAILAIVAAELYSTQLTASRRTDGINSLFAISLAEERYRTTNTTYGTLSQVWGGVTASTGGYYTLAVTANSATSYTLTATAVGGQSADKESGTSCTTLTLSAVNGTITQTPAICWPS